MRSAGLGYKETIAVLSFATVGSLGIGIYGTLADQTSVLQKLANGVSERSGGTAKCEYDNANKQHAPEDVPGQVKCEVVKNGVAQAVARCVVLTNPKHFSCMQGDKHFVVNVKR